MSSGEASTAADASMSDHDPADPVLPEHRFATPVTGAAYRTSARVAIVTLCLGMASYGTRVISESAGVAPPVLMLMAAGAAVVLAGAWSILTGKTTVDARGIHQSGVFAKEFRWSEIVAARHVRLPMTSRIVVSTGRGPFKAIHSGTPELDAAFSTIASLYGRRRGVA